MVGDSHTKGKQAEGRIVKEEADVAGLLRHDVEGVSDRAGQGEHAAGEHVAQQRPGV